ncbi:MAG TPA: hypothetical protein VGR10_06410 [Thermoleophilaceae bacterium]|nr:hypothetical protein [Thermoleophilaceae bacterium]
MTAGAGAREERGVTRLGRLADTPPGRVARDRLAASGLLWPLLAVGNPRLFLERCVTPRSDVCIEGFPRSANGFTVLAFRHWNPAARVAHHMHVPLQVRLAVKLGVPCCVLVRPPLDAVASVLVMQRERIPDDACFRAYIRYHRAVATEREQIVTCAFGELLEDPAVVVERLNARFNTSFASQPLTPPLKGQLLATLEQRARRRARTLSEGSASAPHPAKERRKAELHARLATHPLLPEAQSAYAALAPG